MDDHELLRDYVESRSQNAFRSLVERHLAMVYSAACRIVRDSHLAQEIAQDVFTTLARKGKMIRPPQVVSGWLYNTTRHLAMHAIRTEQRRRNREQTAVAMQADDANSTNDQIHEKLEPAMAELDANERDALVLRFLENRSLRDVGAELGISEDAARMRVNRALEHLRGAFGRQGISVTSVLLSTAMASSASSATPTGLALAISTTALAAATTISTLTQTTLTTMNWINAKTAVATVAAAILAGTGTYLTQQLETNRLRAENQTLLSERQTLAAELDEALKSSQATTSVNDQAQIDRSELLRLRNEVGVLRRQNEIVRNEKEKAAAVKPAIVQAMRKPGAFISKEELKFAGYTTPENAMESLLWGTMKGNYEDIEGAISPEIINKVGPQLRENFEKEMTEERKAKFKGIQFAAKKVVNDYTVELRMKSGGEPDYVQRMIRFGDEWKFANSTRHEDKWDQEGQIENYLP